MRDKIANEWWVTLAGKDLDGWNALALCKSLRLTLTGRKICIVVAKTISKGMRELLEESFDYVYDMHRFDDSEVNNIPTQVLLWMSIWKCGFAKRAVFIHPQSLVLKNCDELFEMEEMCGISHVGGLSSQKAGTGFASILSFSPSNLKFEEILSHMNGSLKLEGIKAEVALHAYICEELGLDKQAGKQLDIKYNCVIDKGGYCDTLTKIITFASETPWLIDFGEGCRNPWTHLTSSGLFLDSKKLQDGKLQEFIERSLAEHSLPRDVVCECPTLRLVHRNQFQDTISIIGLSCRFPGANNYDEFWEVLVEGRDETKPLPPERASTRRSTLGEEALSTPAGYLKCPIQDFDAKFFEISRREAEYMDPQQRLLLEVAWESLENAGINPLLLSGTNTAVFAGIWAQEYAMHVASVEQSNQNFQYKYLGNAFCAASARISHFLGLNGSSTTIEAGCASALQGVHNACECLRDRQTDLAISCGVNIALGVSGELSSLDSFIISKDGKCKTFDESADGFARGEACVSLVLKRTPDAIRDGDSILGIIRGSALNNDGGGTALGTPSAPAQELVLKMALDDSKIRASDVSFIEAHGTGTPVGDPTEFQALNRVYGGGRAQPLIVGSVKTNIGHTEGCSGLAGLVKVLLCMQHRTIPKHLHLQVLNPYINLHEIPAIIPRENVDWEPSGMLGLIAGVSSFGLSGTNVHVILQEPQGMIRHLIDLPKLDRTGHVFALSAKSESALAELAKSYISLLETSPNIKLADLAYSANTGRGHFRSRYAVVAKDTEQLLHRLKKGLGESGERSVKKNKIAFLFTGQGSQYVRMGENLFQTNPRFRADIHSCADRLKEFYGMDLLRILGYKGSQSESKASIDINSSMLSQPAIFCIEVCLAQLWGSLGIRPDFVVGHSVGEFAAAVTAGIISFEDGLKLVVERSRLVNKLEKGAMAVIRASRSVIERLLVEFEESASMWIDIAAVNSENEVVVSGRPSAIEKFSNFCHDRSLSSQLLLASHAFHSRDMNQILKDYESISATVKTHDSQCTYISGTSSMITVAREFTPSYWSNHLREPVNFHGAFTKLARDGDCTVFVEIGAQPVLLALGMSMVSPELIVDYKWCPTIRNGEDNYSTMLTSVARIYTSGVDIDWAGLDSCYRRQKLQIPNYPFCRDSFWLVSKSQTNDCLSIHAKLVHPLLGRRVPSPLLENVVYHNSLSLDNLPYLRDHVVANKIVLPCAAYLELILAAGLDIICGGTKAIIPLHVEDLTIECALLLEEERCVQIQTVVSSQTEGNELRYLIEVFKQIVFDPSGSDGGKWKKLVSAMVVAPAPLEYNQPLDACSLQDSLTLRDTVDDIYGKLADTGISFGPSFRSIQRFWYSQEELLVMTSFPAGSEKYICHPVILDAMIQTCVSSLSLAEGDMTGLHLPLRVGKFTIHPSKMDCSNLFIHSRRQLHEGDYLGAKLFTQDGYPIATMREVDFIQTTVPAFLRLTNAEGENCPGFYEEVWQKHMGPWAQRCDSAWCQLQETYKATDELISWGLKVEEEEVRYNFVTKLIDDLTYNYIVKAVIEMGWSYRLGEVVVLSEFAQTSGMLPKHIKLFQRWLEILEEEGDLELIDYDLGKFSVCAELPGNETVDRNITSLLSEFHTKYDDVECRFVQHCGEKLVGVMTGKISIYSVLFPDAAASLYRSRFINSVREVAVILFHSFLVRAIEGSSADSTLKENNVVRILEVGAGTGSATELMINLMNKLNYKYEYMVTDVSPLFLNEARSKFASNRSVKYGLYDLEKDPLSQGIPFHYYDVLVADSVFHATQNISETLRNVSRVLRPGGLLFMSEQVSVFRAMDVSFGFMEGWWRFNDYDIRQKSPILSEQAWTDVLLRHGFTNPNVLGEEAGDSFQYRSIVANSPVIAVAAEIGVMPSLCKLWLVFGANNSFTDLMGYKLAQVGRQYRNVVWTYGLKSMFTYERFELNPSIPEHFNELFKHLSESREEVEGIIFLWGMMHPSSTPNETHDFDMLIEMNCGLLHLLQAVAIYQIKPSICVVTSGGQLLEDGDPVHPISATLWGLLQCFTNEFGSQRNMLVDLDPQEELANSADDLFFLIWQSDLEFQVAVRNRDIYYKRLLQVSPYKQSLSLPNSLRYKLQNPSTGLLSDLVIAADIRTDLGPRDVEVKMKCTALNFKDLLLAIASDDMKEISKSIKVRNSNELGLEISGTVTNVGDEVSKFDIGDEVVGACAGGALASHVVVQEGLLSHKPRNLSFEEASILNVAFLTSLYFLIEIGKLGEEDKILIHTASGGVGLAAIQVASRIGADIYVTAGSRRKRNYLRSLGIKHVYNSRNTNYANDIHHDTSGYGVDVVLNSITGVGFKEATLSVCAPNARFLEMSKFNIWTKDEVTYLRPDVFYFTQEISSDTVMDDGGVFGDEETAAKLRRLFISSVENGMYKQIPYTLFPYSRCEDAFRYLQDTKQIGKVVIKIPETTVVKGKVIHKENFFNSNSTYMITGGMGGIGLEVAKWMAASGAQYLVLVGRCPPNSGAESIITEIRGKRVNVKVALADVSVYSQCEMVLQEIEQSYPPLKGIMHAAGVVCDNTILHQNAESLTKVYKPKIMGTANLHVLTKSYNLDHFVLFSSVVSTFGGIGQCNHAAANKYLDAFAQYRVQLGLPCCSINWGPWSDVGAAMKLENIEGALGVRMFTPAQGITALERAMFAHRTNTAVFDIADQRTMEQSYNLGMMFEFIKSSHPQTASTKEYEERVKLIFEAGPHERRELVQDFIEFSLRGVLKLGENEILDPDQDFREMGVDSLMGMEMRGRIQPLLAAFETRTFSLNDIQENRTINKLTNLVFNALNKGTTRDLTETELFALVRSDAVLGDDIVPFNISSSPCEIKSVLLTGATGLLGVYVLRELVKHSANLKIYCMIRASSEEDARDRLADTLTDMMLEDSIDLANVVCFSGNITMNKFGLSDEDYESLVNSVDAIVHCAVLANLILPYGEFGEEDIRSTNVVGLKQILKFAGTGRIKRLLFPGTVYALTNLKIDGSLPDEFPDDDDFGANLKSGYHISKFISEKLLKQAMNRGLPVVVVRHHFLFGDSRTGMLHVKRNYTVMLLMTCQKLGKFPHHKGASISGVPIDIAADITVQILLDQSTSCGVYNVNNPNIYSLTDLHGVFERRGLKAELVPYEEWREAALLYFGGFDPLLQSFQNFFNSIMFEHVLTAPSLQGNANLYANSPKIKKCVPNIDELMVDPIALAELHLDYYESVHGKLASSK